jgi:hypothetical protein
MAIKIRVPKHYGTNVLSPGLVQRQASSLSLTDDLFHPSGAVFPMSGDFARAVTLSLGSVEALPKEVLMLIPKNVQCRIIAALLSQRVPSGFSLEQIERMGYDFDQPWRTYLEPLLDAMEMPPGIDRSSFIASYVGINSQDREIVAREAERPADIPALADLVLPAIEWVWEGWIPRAMLTVLGAMPSAGKSYLALDLAGRIIAGANFPDGTPVRQAGPVIYVDAENVPQIHNQRASAWGLDRSQLYLMGPAANRLMIDFSRDFDRDRLVEWAWIKRPTLIVVDSLSSISCKGENNVEDVRGIFSFLSRVALDYDCGLLLIHHLRKPPVQLSHPRSLTFHDLRGSSHITTVSRSVIGLHWVQTGPHPDLNDPRRMDVLKTNLCRYPPALGVDFQPMAEDPEVAGLVYGPVPPAYHQPTKREECAEWLMALLDERGPLSPGEVVALGIKTGYSQATVYRARKHLGGQVADTRGRQHPLNRWTLADGGDPDQ